MGVAPIMRVARATDNLDAIRDMYRAGLELQVLGEFKDHQGFDGVILGHTDWRYHLEFTSKPGHRVGTAPAKSNCWSSMFRSARNGSGVAGK